MVGVQVAWEGDPSTTRLVPVTPKQHLLHSIHLQHYFPGAVTLYFNCKQSDRLCTVGCLPEAPHMLCLPSLSLSYIASTEPTQPEVLNSPRMEIIKELEVMERKMQSVITTVSDLASDLRQLMSREENYNKKAEDVNPVFPKSSRPKQFDGTKQSRGVLEAASRLVGEVHMAKPGAKSLGTPIISCSENFMMKPGQVTKSHLPAFPVEKPGEEKYEGKGQKSHQEASYQIGAEDQGETSTAVEEGDGGVSGLERGKNPVCLLQELLVANNATHLPKYHLVGEYGPGHSKIFTVYVEIIVGSSVRKFTGSGTSMRKAKQAAASLALNEVGFKQFKTKQSRVEVGEGSSKAKVVERIKARSQEETTTRWQGGQTSLQGSPGQGTEHRAQSSVHGRSISWSKFEGLGFNSVTEYPSCGQVATVGEVEKRSRSRFEQQLPTRKYEQAIKSLRRPFPRHNPVPTSWNDEMPEGLFDEQSSTVTAPNTNLSRFEVRTGDTDDSGSFEDTDGTSDKEMGESNLEAFVGQKEDKLCGIGSSRIDKTQTSSRKFLEKKKYGNRRLEAAAIHCEDKSKIANVRPIMKAERQ